MTISLNELKQLIEVSARIEKISNVSSDGKNLLVRIPKEVREFLRLKKGDALRWLVEKDSIKLEVVSNAN